MTKRFGFTLAEVLITLGIIGVVAAMTIPTLISNTNGAQFKTAYKKALSTLNQAVLMNIAMEDTDFSTLVADTNHQTGSLGAMLTARLQSASDMTSSYFEGLGTTVPKTTVDMEVICTAANITAADQAVTAGAEGDVPCAGLTPPAADEEPTIESGSVNITLDEGDYFVYALADGTYFGFNKNAANCAAKGTANCIGFIDVNGSTGPNTIVECDNGTGTEDEACNVDSSNIRDIYPVFFHGQTVEPATDAARAVLFGK